MLIYIRFYLFETCFFQSSSKLITIINLHTADYLCPFFICGIRSVALVTNQKCSAAFQNAIYLRKAFFQPRPEVNCLKGGDIIKDRIRKGNRRYIALKHSAFSLLNGSTVQLLRLRILTSE